MNLFTKTKSKQGFVKMVILLIIGLLVLSYLGIDLRSTVESQQNKENFSYVWGYTHAFWDKYLAGPADWIWQNIIIDIVWEKGILVGLNLIKSDRFLDMNAVGQPQVNNMVPAR
ncbi:MAG: hypothetical protein WCO30_00785 [bacterium]